MRPMLCACAVAIAACKDARTDQQTRDKRPAPPPATLEMRTFPVNADVRELYYATRLDDFEVDAFIHNAHAPSIEAGKVTVPARAHLTAVPKSPALDPGLVAWANEHRVQLQIDCRQPIPAELRHVACTEAEDAELAMLGQLPSLETLTLVRTKWTGDGLAHLAGLTKLRMLDISGDRFDDASLRHLAGLTSLEALGVQGRSIDGSGFTHLAGLTALHTLSIRYTRATDASLAALAALPQLRAIDLPPGIGDAGIAHVAKLANLVELTAMMSKITDAGVPQLGALRKLRHINIAAARGVTDQGFVELAKLPELESVDVSATAVTNTCLEVAATMPKLRALDADGTGVDRLKCDELNKQHPDVCYTAGVPSQRRGTL